MKNLIDFLELDKDGTWFVVLIFVLLAVIIFAIVKVAKYEIKNFKFYRRFGVSLTKYCRDNYITDIDYAFWKAERDEITQITLDELFPEEMKKELCNYLNNNCIDIDTAIDDIRNFKQSIRYITIGGK